VVAACALFAVAFWFTSSVLLRYSGVTKALDGAFERIVRDGSSPMT
jgi:hypothetical protein